MTIKPPVPTSNSVEHEFGSPVKKVAVVVVLGEIARSPRMRCHAESFASEGYHVHVISNRGSAAVPESLAKDPNVKLSFVPNTPAFFNDLPRLLSYVLKLSWQLLGLSWVFFWSTIIHALFPSCIIVQNPPAIPTLPLMVLYSKIFRCQLIVDWHNYGYSILELSAGRSSAFTKMYRWSEFYFGAKGTDHLTVTDAMKEDLNRRIGVSPVAFHDRPSEAFKPLSEQERIEALQHFGNKFPSVLRAIEKDKDPPGILVSSTSWTEDEDFHILLRALQAYETACSSSKGKYPDLIVFITGKGPQKAHYERLIKKLDFQHVEINLPWLEHEEYPKLLGCADLGVSLHTSSSGLDLPMKVVDMFGAGLPVAAIHFSCISELVKHDVNGLVFHDADELGQQIQDWFCTQETSVGRRKALYRKNLLPFHKESWHSNWMNKVYPMLK